LSFLPVSITLVLLLLLLLIHNPAFKTRTSHGTLFKNLGFNSGTANPLLNISHISVGLISSQFCMQWNPWGQQPPWQWPPSERLAWW